jgi:uncharacterized protein
MSFLQRVTRDGVTPEISRPDPAKVIAGDPVHSTWLLEDVDGLYCGLWQSTPGTWRISYAEWEYVHIHSGHSVLTDADGTATTLKAGDSYMIRPGFEGTWAVIETTLKDFVIRSQGG